MEIYRKLENVLPKVKVKQCLQHSNMWKKKYM